MHVFARLAGYATDSFKRVKRVTIVNHDRNLKPNSFSRYFMALTHPGCWETWPQITSLLRSSQVDQLLAQMKAGENLTKKHDLTIQMTDWKNCDKNVWFNEKTRSRVWKSMPISVLLPWWVTRRPLCVLTSKNLSWAQEKVLGFCAKVAKFVFGGPKSWKKSTTFSLKNCGHWGGLRHYIWPKVKIWKVTWHWDVGLQAVAGCRRSQKNINMHKWVCWLVDFFVVCYLFVVLCCTAFFVVYWFFVVCMIFASCLLIHKTCRSFLYTSCNLLVDGSIRGRWDPWLKTETWQTWWQKNESSSQRYSKHMFFSTLFFMCSFKLHLLHQGHP